MTEIYYHDLNNLWIIQNIILILPKFEVIISEEIEINSNSWSQWIQGGVLAF